MNRAITVVIVMSLLAGCRSGDPPEDQPPTVTAATDELSYELIVYAPEGGRYVLGAIETFIRASGLAYEIKVLEGVTTELIIQGLQDGVFDMVFMHRYPRLDEGISYFGLFSVNVAIFTHPDVGVDSLTAEQLGAIFAGEITNWSQVGGRDLEIVPFILPEFDANTQALRAVALGNRTFSKTADLFPDETSVMLSATGIPGGVGYATWATKKYIELVRPAEKSHEFHVVSIDGLSLDHPDYPLSIVVGFGYLPERQEFLEPMFAWLTEFLRSPQGNQFLQLFDVSLLSEDTGSGL